MQAKIKGKMASARIRQPGKDDKFKAHHLLKVIQIDDNGDAELVGIKDFALASKYEADQIFNNVCNIKHWEFDGKSGQSCTVAKAV